MSWVEVADGCFRRRYASVNLTVGVVTGGDGLLVIDTRSHHREADELLDDLRALSRGPVLAVVNTHAHFDHCFGNARFAGVPRWGHRSVPGYLAERADTVRAQLVEQAPEWAEEMAELVVTPPDRLVDEVAAVDLGDREVLLRHFGLGHTDGDLVVLVPDADAVFAGDLVEQSGPPGYGPDSFPLDWPGTLARLLAANVSPAVVVPGHGEATDRDFLTSQHAEITQVAETIRALAAADVPVAEAVTEGRWPYPAERLRDAVARGYAQLDGRVPTNA